MRDEECVAFLQWALPQLRARWPGFRKVRRQVCRRVARRLETLALPDVSAYRAYLEANADEWPYLDELCRIPISRFYRDRAVFAYLADRALPLLAQAARDRGATRLRAWSAGCGAGEEPYTLRLVWQFSLQPRFPGLDLQILATDIDRQQLARTEVACYSRGSLRELPAAWIQAAFEERGGGQCLRPEFRAGIEFRRQDIRRELPEGPFDVILCRNLVFTYFEETLQREVALSLQERLLPGGVLVLGRHEALPAGIRGFTPVKSGLPIYRRNAV